VTAADRLAVCRAAVQADIAELKRAQKEADRPRANRESLNPRQGKVWKALEALQASVRALIEAEKGSTQ
jgi:non-homologous end joining protein Ku